MAQAAKKLWDKGHEPSAIAIFLRTTKRNVLRLLDTDVWPMGEIPAWAYREDWPLCDNSHEQTPDNVTSAGRCRMCKAQSRPRDIPPGEVVEGARHGTIYGYNHQRCRCPECRGANAAHARKFKARRRAEREKHGQPTG
jgi:hypothetical protein